MIQKLIPILILILCVALLPEAPAISPAPDGCYPNFTTAEGCKALQSLTTGAANTAVGWYSLFGNSTGSFNTAVGAGALDLNTADNNTAVGVAALLLNTTGTNNTANGVGALVFNDSGSNNTAIGASALFSNTTGGQNTANGTGTLFINTTGINNTAVGFNALFDNSVGSDNTATGNAALIANTGSQNTATGSTALFNNTSGIQNTATGFFALVNNTTGNGNTATGLGALGGNNTGNNNTALGDGALANNTSGSANIVLGSFAGVNVATADNVICIGSDVDGEDVSNSCYIGNIFNATSSGGSAVFINSAGKLGTSTSSQRFKDEIKPMDQASEALYALKPVKFRYKKEIDPQGTKQFGLVAEEVEKVNPDLVVRDKEGKPYSVRYEQVNAMLLNEFLKEHRAFVEEQHKVAHQQEEIDLLKTELTEQRSLIQKVSESVELKSSTPQLVANKP
jgi:hypothetical protein